MGIQKSITTKSGVVANYAKLDKVEVTKNKITGDLGLYLSKEASDNGANKLDNFKFEYNVDVVSIDSVNPIAFVYGKIMEVPQIESEDGTLVDYPQGNVLKGNSGNINFNDGVEV